MWKPRIVASDSDCRKCVGLARLVQFVFAFCELWRVRDHICILVAVELAFLYCDGWRDFGLISMLLPGKHTSHMADLPKAIWWQEILFLRCICSRIP